MKESEIRPPELFARYLELVRRDNERFFSDHSEFVDIPCPACGSDKTALSFDKQGFAYRECSVCNSLYMSPRPTETHMGVYLAQAESVKFWSTDFYRQTEASRRKLIFQPRAQLILELARRLHFSRDATFVDIGAGYGILLEEVMRNGAFMHVSGIEPSPDLARDCRAKGLTILEQTLEDYHGDFKGADFMTAFEVLEHVNAPLRFMVALKNALRPGGIALLTTLTASGFDIRTLWGASNAVSPPHHINLLTVEGYQRLVERAGLELVELTTPGALDVDIVRNALLAAPDMQCDWFAKHIALQASPDQRAAFQKFLSENALSSHIRFIVRRAS